MGFKLDEGKGLREGWNSKELWKCVEKAKAHIENRHVRHASRSPPIQAFNNSIRLLFATDDIIEIEDRLLFPA